MDRRYLKDTRMLNYQADSIRELIKERGWEKLCEFDKIKAVYDFVRNNILFGYNRSDLLTAEEVLKDGYGQCNTKATLLMALLRGIGVSCRIHGFEVSKYFQRGATSALISALTPKTIIHAWVEVYYNEKWIALEGVITDEAYVKAVKKKYGYVKGEFKLYAIAVPELVTLDLEWKGNDTYVQKEAIVKDYGVFDTPDEFFVKHPQKWSRLKNFAYVHYGRKVMIRNVKRMRDSGK